MNDKKLEVRNLKISFRTNNGAVKAVRDISFDLHKGETLAIVGESGSGKSVTSRSILGILAPNRIIEGGEIIYNGQDLLKISEADFHYIRGSKISMIFQDPMSSLNPIMKIGKQLTEAMILKGKASQKEAQKEFKSKMNLLKMAMIQIGLDATVVNMEMARFSEVNKMSASFEENYNQAHERMTIAHSDLSNLIIDIERLNDREAQRIIVKIITNIEKAVNPCVIQWTDQIEEVVAKIREIKKTKKSSKMDHLDYLKELFKSVDEAYQKPKPNFFALSFVALENPNVNFDYSDIAELNELNEKVLNEQFLINFKKNVFNALKKQMEDNTKLKQELIVYLKQELLTIDESLVNKKTMFEKVKKMNALVIGACNKFDLTKDSISYTFFSSIKNAINTYFYGVENNPKEEKRYELEREKYEAALLKNTYQPSPVPPVIIDLEHTIEDIKTIIGRIIQVNEQALSKEQDLEKFVDDLIAHLQSQVSLASYKVTKGIAKTRAIKLMGEVGITDAPKRFKQYPFQFSGGMRQRIVIAIALAANPDILICDEPTTALDVTIQAQILELINKLKEERNLSIIFITHDLGVVANISDRIAVMYAGKIVEYGTTDEIFYNPKHPYTWALLSSMPDLETKEKLESIPGTPPNMIFPPKGDAFAARNKYAMQIDFEEEPPLFKVSETHYAATWLLHPDAPQVTPPRAVTDRIAKMNNLGGNDNE